MSIKKTWIVFIVLVVVYLLELLLIPANGSVLTRYSISAVQAKVLGLTVALPLIAIWFAGFYAYARLKEYAMTIRKDEDGKAFNALSNGLLLLSLWLPINSVLSNLTTYWYRTNPGLTEEIVIANNYINLAFSLAGFVFLYLGSYELARISRKPTRWRYLGLAPLISAGGLFIYLAMNNPARQFPTATAPVAGFYLPDWLLVGTIIIPYLLIFYFGIFSIVYLYSYRKSVKGKIYKAAIDNFAQGVGFVVTSVILIRYMASLTSQLNSATLKVLLMVIYLLLLLLGAGFVLLVVAAKKLHKIEEI